MRPTSRSKASGIIFIGRSIGTPRQWIFCFARIAVSRLHKPSSAKRCRNCLPWWPRKKTLDGLRQSHLALRLLRREDPKWKYVQVRCSQYLNNLIEQDHRAIKRRCASMGGFKSFSSAAITLAGIELAHRIRKRQFSLGPGRYRNFGSLKQICDRALA